jgi:hypothetical protein
MKTSRKRLRVIFYKRESKSLTPQLTGVSAFTAKDYLAEKNQKSGFFVFHLFFTSFQTFVMVFQHRQRFFNERF